LVAKEFKLIKNKHNFVPFPNHNMVKVNKRKEGKKRKERGRRKKEKEEEIFFQRKRTSHPKYRGCFIVYKFRR
jgi:hypothetical protein